MGLFPAYIENEELIESEVEERDIPREFELDFSTGQLTGNIVEGIEAIRVWIYIALQVVRYRYFVLSWDYGNEIETLYGKGYSLEHLESEISKMIEDCLLVNKYIEKVDIESVKYRQGKLTAKIVVTTIYKEEVKQIYETEAT